MCPVIAARNDLTELASRVWSSFVGRCVQRFLMMSGIDRCLMLSSQAFTALIPLLILVSTLAPAGHQDVVTNLIIRRFGLQGESAAAVRELFEIPSDTTGGISTFSAVLLVASGTSFARRFQRMYREAWELEKAGVRSGLYAALGLLVLLAELMVLYGARVLVQQLPLSWLFTIPVSLGAGLVLWTTMPYLLLDRRVHWRRLLASGVIAAVATSADAFITTLYMPGLVERYTAEYGLFGITIALIGWLLVAVAILVGSAAIGAEFDASRAPWAVSLRTRFRLEDPARERPAPSADDAEVGLSAGDFLLLLRVVTSWLVLAAAVWVATVVVPGIWVPGGPTTYLVAALVLGLLNALLSALPHAVRLPLAPLAVGLSALVVNAMLLGLTSLLTNKLEVADVGSAILGGLVISVVTTVLELLRLPFRTRWEPDAVDDVRRGPHP